MPSIFFKLLAKLFGPNDIAVKVALSMQILNEIKKFCRWKAYSIFKSRSKISVCKQLFCCFCCCSCCSKTSLSNSGVVFIFRHGRKHWMLDKPSKQWHIFGKRHQIWCDNFTMVGISKLGNIYFSSIEFLFELFRCKNQLKIEIKATLQFSPPLFFHSMHKQTSVYSNTTCLNALTEFFRLNAIFTLLLCVFVL